MVMPKSVSLPAQNFGQPALWRYVGNRKIAKNSMIIRRGRFPAVHSLKNEKCRSEYAATGETGGGGLFFQEGK